MDKTNSLTGIIVGILLVVGVLAYGASTYKTAPTSPDGTLPPTGPISVEGVVLCLPHKNPGEFQTMECAYGLKNDAGTYFALSDTDPMYRNVGNVPMNIRVKVDGSFTPRTESNYQDIGVISVTKITRLDSQGTPSATSTTPVAPQDVTTKMDQPITALGVTITPREILEDSRCPINAVCIQAGTVRVRADVQSSLGASSQIFQLDKETAAGTESIKLVKVEPSNLAGQPIAKNTYVFHFRITKR